MTYQQPPGGGYPPPGYPQQPQQPASQGYPMPDAYRTPMAPQVAGAGGLPAGLIQLAAYGAIALGLVLRGITGLMSGGSGTFKVLAIANLFVGLGLLGLFITLLDTAVKSKDTPTAVRTGIGIVAVLVVLPLSIWITSRGFL